jgi:hypothetical protein
LSASAKTPSNSKTRGPARDQRHAERLIEIEERGGHDLLMAENTKRHERSEKAAARDRECNAGKAMRIQTDGGGNRLICRSLFCLIDYPIQVATTNRFRTKRWRKYKKIAGC